MMASSRRSAAAAPSCPAPCPTPPSHWAAPPPNSPSPPTKAVRRSYRRYPVGYRGGRFACAALVLFLGAGLGDAADPAGRYQGALGGTAYLINVPPDWNGGLVMFAHGYEGEGSGAGTARSS